MEQAEAAAIRARADQELKKIPGVLGVGFGRKEVDGEVTRQPALRVYVAAKKAPAELSPAEMIPSEFEGVPTDVLTVKKGKSHPCEDTEPHSPLTCGITITNFKTTPQGIPAGTLGFFATLDGVTGPENVVLVSNNHVLTSGGAAVGDSIFHPQWKDESGTMKMVNKTGYVGDIHNIGKKGHHNYGYPTEAAQDYYVDAATAKLNICISSWCDTNCGISYKNEVRGLAIGASGGNPGNSKIEDIVRVTEAEATAPTDYVVYKVGRTTSRTRGHVTETFGTVEVDGVVVNGVMIIVPLDPDCDAILRFSTHGDSGSPVINEQNRLVGILFGGADDETESWASHIHPVVDLLKITVISTANPPVGPAGQARSDARGFFDGVNETIPLRDRFLRTPVGQRVHEAVIAHRDEVMGLINHRRPVTVAWHRGKGPAFLGHGIENVRNPDHRVPRAIEGVERAALARRIAAALAEHGSLDLKRAMDEWLPFVLTHIDDFDSLHDLVGRFEPEPADA